MRIPRRKPDYPYGDNDPIYFGDGSDASIYYDGANFVIHSNETGHLLVDAASHVNFTLAGYDAFQFTANANYSIIYGSSDAADTLELFANQAQAYGHIAIGGGADGHLDLFCTAGGRVYFYKAATIMCYFDHNGANTTYMAFPGHMIIYASGGSLQMEDNITLAPIIHRDVALLPTGTGLVKFGTYTATAALASTGYIDIVDAAGTARKLMVQA